MPRVIVSSRFLKPQLQLKRSNLVRYVATRETVEMFTPNRIESATDKQGELIDKLLGIYPDGVRLLEYQDYTDNPTKENASELITELLEHTADTIGGREIFVKYMAERPGVEKIGKHGLFNAGDDELVLSDAIKQVANHSGNIWTHVVSLRREDAERLGYTTPGRWQQLVRHQMDVIAQAQNIRIDDLRWFAAFHNTAHHPHIHLLVFSADPRRGYLTNDGIEKIRSSFANEIFHDELNNIYEKQTQDRDKLRSDSAELMRTLMSKLQDGTYSNPELESLVQKLSEQLKHHKGKKQYGYLQPNVKKTVDNIVLQLSKNDDIAKMYKEWCELEQDKYSTYTNELKTFPPLHENKVFKPIKNRVIDIVSNMVFVLSAPECAEQEQQNISETDIDIPIDFIDAEPQTDTSSADNIFINWSSEYKSACHELYNTKDIERALVLLRNEADKGNVLAMHDLGMIYDRGLVSDENAKALAEQYYRKALNSFMSLESKGCKLQPYIRYRIGKMFNIGKGTEQDYSKAFTYFEKSALSGNKYAQFSLGSMFRLGTGVEQSYDNAYLWYEKSAIQGNPYACFETAKLLRDGKGVTKDISNSDRYFRLAYEGFTKLAADIADDKLLYRLGSMTMNGTGCDKDTHKAIDYYIKAAELKNDNALYELGKLLIEGKVIFQDIEKGIDMLTDASETNQNARYYLAKLYLGGEVVEQDIEKALSMMESCTDNPYAMYMLGKIYSDGRYIAPIYSKAEHYFKLAADKGLDCAEYALGKLYLSDRYKHIPLAKQYLSSAAEHGNSYAMYALAKLHLSDDTLKDVDKAVELLTQAHRNGNSMGSYALGKLYLYGGDVKRDTDTARYWLTESANMGNEYASVLLQNIHRHNQSTVNNAVLSMLFSFSRLISDDYERKNHTRFISERKLKAAISRKKKALGLKDDHTIKQEY